MKKATKVLVGALILTVILIVAVTGVASAASPDYGKYLKYGECPENGECQCDGECQCEGECQYDGECFNDGSCIQTMAQNCVTACEQNQNNIQYSGESNCYANQYCHTKQNMHGIDGK